MCRFSKEIDNSFTPICGDVELDNTQMDTPILGVLPFLSPTAAVFLLAELGKLALSYPVNNNFVQFSMKQIDSSFISQQRNPDTNCICKDQAIEDYPREITESRFWGL